MYLHMYTPLKVSLRIVIPLFVPQTRNISKLQQPKDSNITKNNTNSKNKQNIKKVRNVNFGDQMYSQNQQKENSDMSQNKAIK